MQKKVSITLTRMNNEFSETTEYRVLERNEWRTEGCAELNFLLWQQGGHHLT